MSEQELRDRALDSLKKKTEFRTHVVTYVLVNTMLVAIWALSSGGFFWPIFPILGWGIGLALHGWEVYVRQDATEDQIRREMDRLR
jgi:hypothetical protein